MLMIMLPATIAAMASGRTNQYLVPSEYAQYFPIHEARLCEPADEGSKILSKIWDVNSASGSAEIVKNVRVSVVNKRTDRGGGSYVASTSAILPTGSTWYGLPLQQIETEATFVPESEAPHRLTLTFAISLSALQRALARLHADVAAAPGFKSFHSEPYDGRQWVEARGAGSALVCESDG